MSTQSQETVITLVEKQKRNKHRYNIYLNDEYAFSVHEDVLIKYRLLKGELVDKDQLDAILAEDEKHRAYLDAVRFISFRPRTVKEVKDKLKSRGYEDPLIDKTIASLQEQNYLNDEEFAQLWTEQRISLNMKGRKWVKMELAQKGVSKDTIAKAMDGINEEEEQRSAIQLAVKKWPHLSGERPDRIRKLYGFLMRRGYSGSIIQEALKEASGSGLEEEYED